jgi:arabinan endo-1,5-alpha-L-arabinosidase
VRPVWATFAGVHARAAHLAAVAVTLIGPAVTEAQTLELESGRRGGEVVSDRGAHGGRAVALTGRTGVRRHFFTRSAVASVALRARRAPCAGPPRLSAALDGRRLGSRLVRSRRYRLYRFATHARAGRHVLRLAIAGLRRGRSCRRWLLLDSLRLGLAPLPRPSAPPHAPPPPVPAAGPAPSSAPPAAPSPSPPAAPAAYRNPVFAAPGAPDPMVLDVGGTHSDYFAFSTGGRFPVLRSRDLVSWQAVGTAMTARPAWAVASGDYHPWAPSVIESPGPCPGETGTRCFVLFYVSRHATLSPPTNCIGVATSARPEGPYTDLGPLEDESGSRDASGRPVGCGDDRGYSNIDPAPFVDSDGRAFLYLSTTHACLPACSPVREISVLGLTPDLLLASTARQPLFSADSGGWEKAPWAPVVENPWVVKRADRYFLLYSGGSYLGPYGMGYATATSPIGPFTKAVENPILRESPTVLSPGGGSLATGPRGGDWLVYHGREGASDQPRQLRIDPVTFTDESTVSVAGPTSTPQAAGP